MKTVHYFLPVCICLCLTACTGNSEPGEEPEIEEPCPELADVNPHFIYGNIPYYSERLTYMGMERPPDSYNYPVYPFSGGWAEATDGGREGTKVCQITPECLLRKMSTQAVIQAIWELPILENFFYLIDPYLQSNMESRRFFFNAYAELYSRKDAGAALFERLMLVDPLTSFLRCESQHLELLLSRTDFLSQLSANEKRKTVEIALSNYEKRYAVWWDVGGSGDCSPTKPTAWILMGKAMYAVGYGPFIKAMNEHEELKYFVEGWRPDRKDPSKRVNYLYWEEYYVSSPQIIIDHAKNYIND